MTMLMVQVGTRPRQQIHSMCGLVTDQAAGALTPEILSRYSSFFIHHNNGFRGGYMFKTDEATTLNANYDLLKLLYEKFGQ